MPVAGYFIDKFGIRNLVLVGATLIDARLGTRAANSPRTLFHLCTFSTGVMVGFGAGIIYIATVANAVKWFPDKRGLWRPA